MMPVSVHLARMVVPTRAYSAFREAVFANMRVSVERDRGVLAVYAARTKDDPCAWCFREVYGNGDLMVRAAKAATSRLV